MLHLDVYILKTPILLVMAYTPSLLNAFLSGMLLVEPLTPILLLFPEINSNASSFTIFGKTISICSFVFRFFTFQLFRLSATSSLPFSLPSLPLPSCPPFFYFYWCQCKYCTSLLCLGSTPRTVFCMGTFYRVNQCAHFLTSICPLVYYFLELLLILSICVHYFLRILAFCIHFTFSPLRFSIEGNICNVFCIYLRVHYGKYILWLMTYDFWPLNCT